MTSWRLAFRNIWRNERRSLVTVLAIALSCSGLMLFGGYVSWAHLASEVHTVWLSGHVQLFKDGYLEKGSGNPAAYAMANYDELRDLLAQDSVLGPRLELVTGQLLVNGMVNNSSQQTSSTFIGYGCFADAVECITRWNPYGLVEARDLPVNKGLWGSLPDLDDADADGVTIGNGLAAVLELSAEDFAKKDRPTLELLTLPAGAGLPNMVSASVRQKSMRALEHLDDHLVIMPIKMASDLMFPGEPLHVTSIQLLLKHTEDTPLVQQRIAELNAQHHLGIEQRTCAELNPNHARSLGMLDMFFVFAFCIVAVVLVFMIYNTMMMGIVERTREIGALRAMGLTRGEVIAMFLREGVMLGIVGSSFGVVLGLFIAWCINRATITYVPPYINVQAKLEIFCTRPPAIIISSFCICLLVALVGALFPARQASRMEIAEALRH